MRLSPRPMTLTLPGGASLAGQREAVRLAAELATTGCCVHRGVPACLQSLECLETCALSSSPACSTHVQLEFFMPRNLKHLCMNHMLPRALFVPTGCRVTLMGRSCCLDNSMGQ